MRPVLALLCAGAALWAGALAGSSLVGSPGALLVVAALALWVGRRTGWSGSLLTGCGAALLLAVGDQAIEGSRFSLASDGVFYGVMVLGPLLVGRALAARHDQMARLQAERRRLERRRETVVAAAVAEEVVRVERQVDGVLAVRLRELATAAHSDRPDAIEAVESSARSALGDLRTVLGDLHQHRAEPSPPRRSRPALGWSWVDAVLLLAGAPLAVETGPSPGNVVAALVQGACLPVVRRRPVLGAALLLATACVQTRWLAPVPPTVSWLVPGLLLALLVGAARRRRDAVAGLGVTLAGVGLMTVLTPAPDRGTALLPGLVLGLIAWAAGRALAARDRRVDELVAIAEELAATEESETRLAAARRRSELAHELHDVGAHALTVVCLQAEAARTWWDRDPARAEEAMRTVRRVADGPLAALGESLGRLDAADIDADVVAQLGRALHLDLTVEVIGTPVDLPEETSRAALRVVQEALTNAARHGGGPVRVVLDHRGGDLHLVVRDRGAPSSGRVVGAGRGLRGMEERAAALDGALVVGPAGDGFEIDLRLPVGVAPR